VLDAAEADQRRFEQIAGPPEAITGSAHSPDGSVTVEVGMGGGLRSIRLSRDALRNGGADLARTILDTARNATAKANHRAHYAFGHAIGPSATNTLERLGIADTPAEDEDRSQHNYLDRGWQR
jgi:hypothetical protein